MKLREVRAMTPAVGQVWACKRDEADPYRYGRSLVVVQPRQPYQRIGYVRIRRIGASRSSEVGAAAFARRYRYVAASVAEWEAARG